jgi:hypothetical protein
MRKRRKQVVAVQAPGFAASWGAMSMMTAS